jgi:hypothetical protein
VEVRLKVDVDGGKVDPTRPLSVQVVQRWKVEVEGGWWEVGGGGRLE